MDKSRDCDEVNLLSPVAIGTPGKRTFFLSVSDREGWLRIWLEKQDLQTLARAIRQLLIELPENTQPSSPLLEDLPGQIPSGLPKAEFDLRGVVLGYEDGHAILDLTVESSGVHESGESELHCRPTLAKLSQFAVQAERVCAAGRPICPLCGSPINQTGHICPRLN